MKRFVHKFGFNLILGCLLIIFGFGVSTAYEKYRGTGLSRLPKTTPVDSSRLSDERPNGWDPAGTFELVATSDVLLSPDIGL